ncbi:MAG: MFS transporter [Planctomycetes bacterium]|nr:MFS transporter [Planctomycetota bacterium]NOG55373.1 MFS transporter [Planctomycetota bacterium]
MPDSDSQHARGGLLQRGFGSLIATQFLGAANDNVLKQTLIFMIMANGLWAEKLGKGGQGVIGLCLTLPFILLSGYAGQYADRNSKQVVTVQVKAAEIGIAITAGIGLWLGWFWISLVAFIALAVQSAFFGPAKYGMIPELVNANELSRANGVINMFTNIAVIIGTLIAGPVCELFWPKAQSAATAAAAAAATDPSGAEVAASVDRMVWLPLAVMLVIAILGFCGSLFIPKLPAKEPTLKYNSNPFSTYYYALREMAKGPLLPIAIAWAYFYMVGFAAILLLPEYEHLLSISYTKASILFAVLAISIGVGSALAGLISGKRIEPRLVPVGAVGVTVFLGLLGFVPGPLIGSASNPHIFWVIAGLLAGAGAFAGAYLIPLQALIQDLAPENERGRYLGTTNALSFVFSSLGAIIVQVSRSVLHMQAHHVFFVCGGLGLIGTVYLFIRFRKPLYAAVKQAESHYNTQ